MPMRPLLNCLWISLFTGQIIRPHQNGSKNFSWVVGAFGCFPTTTWGGAGFLQMSGFPQCSSGWLGSSPHGVCPVPASSNFWDDFLCVLPWFGFLASSKASWGQRRCGRSRGPRRFNIISSGTLMPPPPMPGAPDILRNHGIHPNVDPV